MKKWGSGQSAGASHGVHRDGTGRCADRGHAVTPARRTVLFMFLTGCALAFTSPLAMAQSTSKSDWPNRPVKLVVPFQAGGATDVMARAVGESLARRTGQPVIVENKGGAGGIIGTDAVAKAPPDGYTLLFSNSASVMTNQFLYARLPYQPLRDLSLISQVVTAPVVLTVSSSLPVNNVKELLAHVKSQRGRLSYGSWGNGSYAHLAGAYISKLSDADLSHVAYKGEAPMVQDLVSGVLPMAFASALLIKPHLESGRLRAIAVTGRERMEILPRVPTFAEQGITDDVFAVTGWLAMAAPAGLPKSIEDALAAHLKEIAREPRMQERLESGGFTVLFNHPNEFRAAYLRDMPVWKRLVEMSEARLD